MNDKTQPISPHAIGNSPLDSQGENTEGAICISSADLLGDAGVATIIHQGQRYQLRQTKAGKLILTK